MDKWKNLASPPRAKTGRRRPTRVVAACTSPFWSAESVSQIVLDPTTPAVMHPQRLYEQPATSTFVGNPYDVNPNRSATALAMLKKRHMIDLGPHHNQQPPTHLSPAVRSQPAMEAFYRRGELKSPRMPSDMGYEFPLPPSRGASVSESRTSPRREAWNDSHRDRSGSPPYGHTSTQPYYHHQQRGSGPLPLYYREADHSSIRRGEGVVGGSRYGGATDIPLPATNLV